MFSHFESDSVTTWLYLPEVHLFCVYGLRWECVLPAYPTRIWSLNYFFSVLSKHLINNCIVQYNV